MNITNKLNWPEYLVTEDSYKPNPEHMSTTDLVKPPLMRTLYLKHWEEIEQDISERFNLISGNSWDDYCKKHCVWALTKIRLEMPTLHGLTIICKPDYYHVLDYILADFKEKSVWNLKKFDPTSIFSKENIAQVNIYDLAMFKSVPQLRIDKLQLHIRGKDWRKIEKIRYGHEYPDTPFAEIDIERWSHEEQEQYVDTQMQDHIQHPNRECTSEEKMQTGDQYAVMKKGRKSALRVLDSEQDAISWCNCNGYMNDLGKSVTITKRPGECVRCNQYCSVSRFCEFYKKTEND